MYLSMVWYVVVASSFTVFAAFTVMSIFSRLQAGNKRPAPVSNRFPFVSILKPVLGVDNALAENIESFYRSAYPNFEIVFCVEAYDDPCLKALLHHDRRHGPMGTGRNC